MNGTRNLRPVITDTITKLIRKYGFSERLLSSLIVDETTDIKAEDYLNHINEVLEDLVDTAHGVIQSSVNIDPDVEDDRYNLMCNYVELTIDEEMLGMLDEANNILKPRPMSNSVEANYGLLLRALSEYVQHAFSVDGAKLSQSQPFINKLKLSLKKFETEPPKQEVAILPEPEPEPELPRQLELPL